MTVDAEHGLLLIATSPPSPDDYGGDRKDEYPYANAVVALNADTGQVVWSASSRITSCGTTTSPRRRRC